ncbi:MAG TPA: type II toxin-antitoxin system RelE/ParE family toxin [bacterium (Candidatus Stahlbacteria)]|nr:type II toxin-antitoxin system RelE/ParE family toxin [Candidatus Stahlbacteria bacterium]
MYEVYLERRAERDLKNLEPKDFYRIISHIKKLSKIPRPAGCRKITGSQNDWRIRIGKFRVLYEVDDEAKIVKIMSIRHRRAVYRKR